MTDASPLSPESILPLFAAGDPRPRHRFRALWLELHRRPLAYAGDAVAERAWFDALPGRLPDGCGCRDHLSDYLHARPPHTTSAAALALWTFDLHASVNLRLGRPGLTLRDAIALYGWGTISGFDAGSPPDARA